MPRLPITDRLRSTALVVIVLAAALSAGRAADANAATIFTTTYYTINVMPPTASGHTPAAPPGSGLYLANAPNGGVNLQRYFSGAPGEQWVPITDPAWPGQSPITGTSGLNGFVDCITHLGCPFHVSTSEPHKFVNRLTGKCLTVDASNTRTALTSCARSGAAKIAQVFQWGFTKAELRHGVVPRRFTQLVQTPHNRARCVNAANNTLQAPIVFNACSTIASAIGWRQSFRFLEVATVTCTKAKVYICGLPPG